jgi:hypothetical protein
MKALLLPFLLLIAVSALAETRAMRPATREGLVGVWEALVQDGSMATEVYQMIISKEGDARLIQLVALPDDRSYSKFFGRATSIDLLDGTIKLRFTMAPEHVQYCDWVEIQGFAVAEGEGGAITGKIIMHRPNGPPHEWTEAVAFKKGPWIHDLERISNEADRILRDPTFEDGHAVPKEKAKSP